MKCCSKSIKKGIIFLECSSILRMIQVFCDITMTIVDCIIQSLLFQTLISKETGMKTRLGGPGPHFNIKVVFLRIGIPLTKIRWSWNNLIFEMGIPILVK